ncbi:MAG: 2-oxoacid:acceptor oxidoreductase subunit alpha [Clostridia bacterium]|jgi:2-oxoglutarate ferredoxin oxidoreductase subunit alpha|nr:2-oxoacid:acceptor oxidoreductase subunit alpha [Clostridia bacterium]MDD4666330.1 2-oxoacid:acceptor oxidoreductase subunit alpha [Clostridia bacterium]
MTCQNNIKFMQGNEAVAEAAILAGVRFFAGYPITPATEIAEILARKMPLVDGVFLQMEDEIASMAAVIGASMAGVKAMTSTSGPGFTLKQENLGYAAIVEIPCVVVDVQRGGPSTGLPTLPAQGDVMQARWGTHGDHPIVVLSPATVAEAFDLTVQAINLSELLRTPVILLSDAVVGHIREKVEIPSADSLKLIERKITNKSPEQYQPYVAGEDGVPEFAYRGKGYRYHITSNIHDEAGFPATNNHEVADSLLRRLHAKIDYYKDELTFYKEEQCADAEFLIIAYGCVARSAKEAVHDLRKEGIKAGLLQLQTLWPFPAEIVQKYCAGVKKVIVPEMNLGQLINEVKLNALNKDVIGVNRVDGRMITPQEIAEKVKEVK